MEQIADKHLLANGTQPQADDALCWAQETNAKMVDVKFCDLLGSWQHMTVPVRALDAAAFAEGIGFDGSSIRGWEGIAGGDMLFFPAAASPPPPSPSSRAPPPPPPQGHIPPPPGAPPGAPRSTCSPPASLTRRT